MKYSRQRKKFLKKVKHTLHRFMFGLFRMLTTEPVRYLTIVVPWMLCGTCRTCTCPPCPAHPPSSTRTHWTHRICLLIAGRWEPNYSIVSLRLLKISTRKKCITCWLASQYTDVFAPKPLAHFFQYIYTVPGFMTNEIINRNSINQPVKNNLRHLRHKTFECFEFKHLSNIIF